MIITPEAAHPQELKRTLGPVMLWGLGVAYVISGMYFGWNLGLPVGGTYGLLGATIIVTIMYLAFVMSYSELACAMPKAGGAFVYASRAFGAELGFVAGAAQILEFLFAPPAIAYAIGAYVNLFFPAISPLTIAIVSYLAFTALNIYGVQQSATFALIVTVLAVAELLIFSAVTIPSFSWAAFSLDPLPHGWVGIFPAIPYAIWFYLAIEGVANTAEEVKNPQRDISIGFITSMLTLVVLALLVFFSAIGVNGWQQIVYLPGTTTPSDSPLPLAMAAVVGDSHFFYHLLVSIGLFGLVASFHGIILVAGRATFEFGRIGYAPKLLGKIHSTRHTPANALIVNMLFGFLALLTGHTSDIITLSVFGALTLYVISMLSLFRLRKTEPTMARPFRTPGYPFVPATALVLAALCLLTMTYYNFKLALIYTSLMTLGYLWFLFVLRSKA